jgi:hypothetical protein
MPSAPGNDHTPGCCAISGAEEKSPSARGKFLVKKPNLEKNAPDNTKFIRKNV